MATKARINTCTYYLLYEKSRRKSSFFVQFHNFFERLYQEVGISYTGPLKKLRKYLAQLCMAHGRKLKLARVLYKKSRRKSSCFVHSRFTDITVHQCTLYYSVALRRGGQYSSLYTASARQRS